MSKTLTSRKSYPYFLCFSWCTSYLAVTQPKSRISELIFRRARLGPDASVHAGNGLFLCANCHCTLESDAGISVHAGNFFSQIAGNAWEGPFMCSDCKTKQDAAEKDAKQDTNQGSAPQQQGETGLSPPLTS